MGTLLGSGVNATESLRLAEKAIVNGSIRETFPAARTRINEGASFSSAFRRGGLLDEAELDILLVNESTGTLPRPFDEIARIRMESLDNALRDLVRSLCALFLIAAFSIVFFCLVAVMLSVCKSAGVSSGNIRLQWSRGDFGERQSPRKAFDDFPPILMRD